MTKLSWVVFRCTNGGRHPEFYVMRNGEDGIPVVVDGCFLSFSEAQKYADWLNRKTGAEITREEAHIFP